ncbi:MAG: DUF3014 domain-containing protein [Gammaproteobacteria bacterium]|nr:DUF3014 domain-containing protein [Gammaproteobacteria bacterium]
MDGRDVKLLVAILLAAVVAGAAWYFRDQLLPQPEQAMTTPPEPAIVEAGAEEGPEHPIAPPEVAEPVRRNLVTLPPLDDSDGYFLLELADVFGADIETLLVKEALIDKFVATVDNLPRDHVAEKVRPVGRLAEPFRVVAADSDGPIYLSAENHRRYDLLISRIATADIDSIVDTYRRFYPLFQESYEHLGYPDGYFNDRVVEVIDHLLATPQPDEPIRLVRPHVLYEFADPQLQALSSGQKLMLRVGSDHAVTVKRVLRDLRTQLARQ